jgi:hypothetical protein
MKKTITVFVLSICLTGICSSAVIFYDDFESISFSKWTSSSDLGIIVKDGNAYADIQQSSIYGSDFSERFISKTFGYEKEMHFSFDMRTSCHSNIADPASAIFADTGVSFTFFDVQSNVLGCVKYGSCTSSYPVTANNSLPDKHYFQISDGPWNQYSLDIKDILSYITIDQNALSRVELKFSSYITKGYYGLSAAAWIDNVIVTPEPASLLLLSLGGLVLRKKKH